MSNLQFQKASKRRAKARIAIDGPSGAGKTYSALIAATVLAEGGRVAVIDTERGSASLYSDEFNFDVVELADFNPRNYVEAIEAAEAGKYAVIVIDSLSHAWEGEGGALDMVDQAAKRSKSGNNFTAWRDVTPIHRRLVEAMLQSPCHIVATMRSKTEYVLETIERNGRSIQQPKKIGMAPIQRAGMEYEFTIVADMDVDHNLAITKSRCKPLADKVENKPGPKFWKLFLDWLNSGEAAAPAPARAPAQAPADEPQHEYTEAQIGPDFDAPMEEQSPAPAAAPAAKPTKAMWEKFAALAAEAKALGLTFAPLANDSSAQDLADAGKNLRAAVENAKAVDARTPAAGGNGKKATRGMMLEKLGDLAREAKALNIIGPAWVPSTKWTDDEIIGAGRSLVAKIKRAKEAKEPQHA